MTANTVAYIVSTAISGAIMVLANATETLTGFPWGNFANLGAVGMLAWYLWFTNTKTLPAIVDRQSKQLAEIVTQFRADLTDERRARREDLIEERKIRTEELRLLRDSFRVGLSGIHKRGADDPSAV